MVRHEGSSRRFVYVGYGWSRQRARGGAFALALAAAVASTSCGEVARTGRSPAFAIIDVLDAASGAEPDTFSTVLHSDVQTLVEQTVGSETVRVPTFFNDLGRASFRLSLKNPGLPTGSLGPSDLNSITFTRYHVSYRRSDGRATPGRDVPYPFDGAFTLTVSSTARATAVFDLVRNQAKLEPPLANLVGLGGAVMLSTIAEVTFYGQDQAGNEVVATATISVNFGDFGDPE